MTRREHDAATKWNHGERMPSDTREDYRRRRMKDDHTRAPLLERRAAYRRVCWPPLLVLGRTSPFRAPALYRAGLWR